MMVSTGNVTNILTNSADASGLIIDLGEGANQRGHCYATTPNPTITGTKTALGNPATGSFTSQLTNLEAGSKYYIKAYISNGPETVYGEEINFTTVAASVPTITTATITAVTEISATSGGNITSDGGAAVTARGVCWNITTNPTTNNSKSTDGTGTGSFASTLTGLTPGTTYYVRAYATNSEGTAYGNQLSFSTTAASLPSLTTTAITGITQTTATSGGDITSNGGAAVTASGVCWSTSVNPVATGSHTTDGTATGIFTSSITGLTANTTYYVRAYATNSIGTAYGNEISFTTNATTTVVPTLTTTTASSITQTTATSGGNITSNGGATVTVSGVCWNTSVNPVVTGSHTTDGTATGAYTSSITGLTANTTYYVRAYATNSIGTAYGNEISFTTNSTTTVVPTLTTTATSSITQTSATSGGNITNNGGATVTASGVCWSTSANPVATGSHTTDGTPAGIFTSSITGLTPGVTYYVRAYATNSAGTAYGNVISFTTLQPPSATTTAATSVTNTTATLNGSVNANNSSTLVYFEYGATTSYGSTINASQYSVDGNTPTSVSIDIIELTSGITYHFRVVGTSPGGTTYGDDMTFIALQPTTATATTTAATSVTNITGILNGSVNANNSSATVTFEYGTSTSYGIGVPANPSPVTGTAPVNVNASISGLTPGTDYHFRVKAVNSVGTAYGNDMTFKTGSSTITDADGNVYNTVTFGTQVWMAENLKTRKYRDGTSIPNVTGNTEWSNLNGGAYSDYNNTLSNSVIYGRLYNWYTVIDGHYLCPAGWHVPTHTEWGTLTDYLGGESVAGGKLKETGFTHWYSPNTGATNEAGFTALPGGYRYTDGLFYDIGYYGYWWTSSYNDVYERYMHYMSYDNSSVVGSHYFLLNGLSIRCLQGEDQVLPLVTTTAVSAIASTTATSGGDVSSTGGLTVTARGVCWSTSANPTIGDPKTDEGTGGGSYTSNIIVLIPCTTYYVRAYATNSIGTSYGGETSFITSTVQTTVTTTAISDITSTSASSGGNVTGYCGSDVSARGVCWSTSPVPTLSDSYTTNGTGSGSFSSSLSGLTANTMYYVRAYATNSAGPAYGDEQIFTTLCPGSLTVTHTAGLVAPVTKTNVNYGIVKTNLSGANKCWITKNLGADNQASSATDNNEQAAGWYWQFNRQQGYKHDGTNRTPNTTWITSIDEPSDWIAANDPCNILLGTGWRIATSTEWFNVSGGWSNFTDPYSSVLKLHAAGYLDFSNGLLYNRGSRGSYYSSTQGSNATGWGFHFLSGTITMGHGNKTDGFSIRCLSD
jgi:uncharacterized protein (TIGR02145 family)